MAVVNPYLNFSDNCEEAFTFYKSVFGGELQDLLRFGAMACDNPAPSSEDNKVMHVSLPIGNGTALMGSDTPESFGAPIAGNNFCVTVGAESADEARRIFDGLSAGGEITMPMDKTFFAEAFGMCTDKFGVHWMVAYNGNQR